MTLLCFDVSGFLALLLFHTLIVVFSDTFVDGDMLPLFDSISHHCYLCYFDPIGDKL